VLYRLLMLRGADWNRTRAVVTAYLQPGEQLETLFTALIPRPESGGVVVTAALIPLVWAVRRMEWERAARAISQATGVPVAPRMIVALTPSRIVIWRAARNWRLGDLSGELSRDRIIEVTAAGGGTRSRRLLLHLSTGSDVVMRVAPGVADRLTAMFSEGTTAARGNLPMVRLPALPVAVLWLDRRSSQVKNIRITRTRCSDSCGITDWTATTTRASALHRNKPHHGTCMALK
jgi:hypothetical protein